MASHDLRVEFDESSEDPVVDVEGALIGIRAEERCFEIIHELYSLHKFWNSFQDKLFDLLRFWCFVRKKEVNDFKCICNRASQLCFFVLAGGDS